MKKLSKILLVSLVGILFVTGCSCSNSKTENKDKDKNTNTSTENSKNEINSNGTLKEETNKNKDVVKTQTVEGITLTNVKFVTTAYNTKITITAKNDTSSDITLQYFKVFLKDKKGKNVLEDVGMEYAVAPVYTTIKAKEEQPISMSIDRDLSDVTSISYEMVK